ncbi:MAG: hypothetical protein KGY80_08695 [Candidatus Thorarchaeota archaeon]|nr:hypothetical protein [Candidatus Thorarchaeota archaeon]
MLTQNLKNRWVLLLITGIILQAVIYPTVWIFQLFEHAYFVEVFVISIASVVVQTIGLGVILSKTADEDPAIYGQGRPFKHKLREEDEKPASRKPTAAE